MTEAQAYVEGWHACLAGVDGRYMAYENEDLRYAWHHGWLDALESQDGEIPEPEWAGYLPAKSAR